MRTLSIVATCFLWATTLAAAEGEPSIRNLTATAVSGQVSVRFQLTNLFRNEQMIQALQSGLPTNVSYVVEIFRDRPNWFDDGIARSRIEIISTYNSLTREYLVNYRRDRKLVRSEIISDVHALERAMTTIDEQNLFAIGNRRPYKLKVRARADLMRGTLLYVIPWQFSTGWREARVRSAPAAAGPTR